MILQRLLRREPEPMETGALTLRRRLLFVLSIITFYGSVALSLWVVEAPGPSLRGAMAVLIGILSSVLAFLMRRGWPRLASWVYLVGGVTECYLARVALDEVAFVWLLTAPVTIAPILLGARGGALVAVLSCAVALSAYGPVADLRVLAVAMVQLAVGCVIGIIVARSAAMIDFWERELVRAQGQMLTALRERQGDLNRTLKALDEAYVNLKRSHDELVLARRDAEEARAREEHFVANVSHELRTPLNLIVGFTEIMYLAPDTYDGVRWTPELQGDVEEMYRASRHLLSLVDDILDLSRIDAARLPMFREMQDLESIVYDATETLAPLFRQRKLELHTDLPESMPAVFVDRTRIRQVLINLLNNAVRFTDQGAITVRARANASEMQVCVEDTGVGIAPSDIGRIFETFRQAGEPGRQRSGAGLGLAISRQFVQLHGGNLTVESTLGKGSSFCFTLPLPGTVPRSAQLFHTADRREASRDTAPVIVIDSSSAPAEMLTRYLDDRAVLAASTVEEAEALISQHHPLAVIVNEPPDAAPERWLGDIGEISARYSVPILRCSIASPSWLRRADGFQLCLTKPVSMATLRELVSSEVRPARILVVDDDPAFVTLMTRMLSALPGVNAVFQAHSGEQALKLAGEKQPDIALVDLVMPEMDGFQVAEGLHHLDTHARMRVIGITATTYGEETLRKRGSYLTLTQTSGMSASSVVESLRALLQAARPNYLADVDTTLSSA